MIGAISSLASDEELQIFLNEKVLQAIKEHNLNLFKQLFTPTKNQEATLTLYLYQAVRSHFLDGLIVLLETDLFSSLTLANCFFICLEVDFLDGIRTFISKEKVSQFDLRIFLTRTIIHQNKEMLKIALAIENLPPISLEMEFLRACEQDAEELVFLFLEYNRLPKHRLGDAIGACLKNKNYNLAETLSMLFSLSLEEKELLYQEALSEKDFETFSFLLKNDLLLPSHFNSTALLCLLYDEQTLLKDLCQKDDFLDTPFGSPLDFSLEKTNEDLILWLINQQQISSELLGEALIVSIEKNFLRVFQELLLNFIERIDVESRNNAFWTALEHSSSEMATPLISFIHLSEQDRGACAVEACKNNLQTIALTLVSEGNLPIERRGEVSLWALHYGNYALLEALLKKGELSTEDQISSLKKSSEPHLEAFALLLLDHGPISQETRETLLVEAASKSLLSLFRYLLLHREADLSEDALDGAFVFASERVNLAMIDLLLAEGYEPDNQILLNAGIEAIYHKHLGLLRKVLELETFEEQDLEKLHQRAIHEKYQQGAQELLQWMI